MPKSDRIYSISDLSREFSCTPRALRFYEDKGILSPRRVGQRRIYTARERGRLILTLQGKSVGLALADIKEILDLYESGGDNRKQSECALAKFRARLQVLETQRMEIENAMQTLRDGIATVEARLGAPGKAKQLEDAR